MKLHRKIKSHFSAFRCGMRKYHSTAKMCVAQVFDGNLLPVTSGYVVRLVRLVILTAVFGSLLRGGADADGMRVSQALTYTLLASVFSEQLYIFTPATTALWEGSIISRFTRPLPVMGGLMAETAGKWIPSLLFYSLPVLLIAPLLGVNILPADFRSGLLFVLSMVLSISLGFAIDFIFSAVAMCLKNGCWAALMIRESVSELLSGALIPFALLPVGVGNVLSMLPFGSIASAPLSIYIGLGNPVRILAQQLIWNIVLWTVAYRSFHKSQEEMISYGG